MGCYLVGFILIVIIHASLQDPPSYEKYIIPVLSANYKVLNLYSVAQSLFNFTLISDQRLKSFIYSNGVHNSEIKIGSKSSFMICGTTSSLTFKGTDYFCIEQDTWDIKTTQKYQPPLNSNETITLLIEAEGKIGSVNAVKEYEVIIKIRRKCISQNMTYKQLEKCKPSLKTMKVNVISFDRLGFELSSQNKGKILKVDHIKFIRLPEFEGTLELYNSLDVLLITKSIHVNETEQAVTIGIKVKNSTDLYMKLISFTTGNVRLPFGTIIEMNYYNMKEFCGDEDCVSNYYYWNWITENIPANEKNCVNDRFRLKKAFDSCYSPFTAVITSSGDPLRYGNALTLKCNYDTLLPHTVKWFRIRDGKITDVSVNNNWYNITKLSYDNYAYYRCSVTTVSDKYTHDSSTFAIKLKDVFTGKLVMRLKDISFASSYNNKKSEIENQIAKLLTVGSPSSNKAECPLLQFFDNNGKLGVECDLSMLKSTVSLQNMNYLQWILSNVETLNRANVTVASSELDDVILYTEETCPSKTTIIGKHAFIWPATAINQTIVLPCPDSTSISTSMHCSVLPTRYGNWKDQDDKQCVYLSAEEELINLLLTHLTEANLNLISKKLAEASTDMITSYEVSLVVDMLDKFVEYINISSDMVNNAMDTVDNILDVNEDILHESEVANKSMSKILEFIGNTGEQLAADPAYTISRKSFAFGSLLAQRTSYKGLTVDISNQGSLNQINFHMELTNHKRGKLESKASIGLPDTLVNNLQNKTSTIAIVVSTFKNDGLFTVNKDIQNTGKYPEGKWNLNTQVIAAEVRGQILKNLDKPVVLKFKAINETIEDHKKTCVYWDMHKRVWTNDGCYLYATDEETRMHTCHCNHLTNFAILFNASPPKGIHGDVLTIITYIGLSISLVGAFLTFITYLTFPTIRENIPPKILINLCAALILMTVLFIAGVERRTSDIGCKAIAICLQYAFLCVFSWSAVEGFHSLRGLVFPMKVEISSFIQKASIFAWGTPIILTAIGASIWHDDYAGEKSCVVGGLPFFVTVLVPVAATILFNIFALVTILLSLKGSSDKYSNNALGAKDRLRIIVTFMVLFGLTWTFGILVISNDKVVFQYLFCILSGFQGLYIFLFYWLRNKKIRRLCWGLLKGKSVKEMRRTSTRRHQLKPRTVTIDSMAFNSLSSDTNGQYSPPAKSF